MYLIHVNNLSPSPPPTTPSTNNPGDEPGVAETVRSLRGAPPLDVLRLAPQPRAASLRDVKALVAAESGLPADRLKLLHRRRPVADAKLIADLLPPPDSSSDADAATLELSVMVMGGAGSETAVAETSKEKEKEKEETKGDGEGDTPAADLDAPAFWDDLRGFLLQRVRDERLAGELAETFQAAWRARR